MMPASIASEALFLQGAALLSYSPAVTVSVTYDHVEGFTTPNRDVFLTLRTGGTTKGTGLGWSDGVGYFFSSFYDAGRSVGIEPGDNVDMTIDGVTTTIDIVDVTGVVDPTTDTVSGTGPANSNVSVFVWPDYSVIAPTDAAGNYSADFSGLVDIRAADWAEISHQDANGNWVSFEFGALGPFQVDETYDDVSGVAAAGQSVDVTIADSSGTLKASGTVTANSSNGFYWYDPGLDIVAGDRVTVTIGGVAKGTVVADLTSKADLNTEVVSGIGPAGDPLVVHLYHRIANGWDLYQQIVTPNAGGAYTADYSGIVDIRRYDWVAVFHPDAAGNETVIWHHPPLVSVNETYNNVWGYAPPGSVVTFTLRTGSTVKETIDATADDSIGYLRADFSQDVTPGDDVDAWGGLTTTVHVPNSALTALADVNADTISGTAPATSTLWVRGWGTFRSFEDYVTSAADETYQDDLSGRYDLYNGYEGHVYYSQPDDHKVFVHYHAPIAHVNTTHNHVWGYAPEPGALVSITVTNGSGVKATATVDASDTDGYFEAFYDGSVDIAPGDTVGVSTNPWSDTIAIQDIQITADPDTGIVSGTGPANEIMVVEAWDDDYGYMAVPSDGAGNYVADLSDQVDLRGGVWVRVAYFTDDGNEVYAYHVIPHLRVNQSHDWAEGYVPPDVPVTATLLAPDSTIKGTGATWSEDDGWFHTDFWDEWGDWADVQAGDTVQVEAGGSFFDEVFVIPMTGEVDANVETIAGQLFDVPFPAEVRGEVWVEGGPGVDGQTDEFGNYLIDFSPYDVREGHEVALWYVQPDGHQVGIVRSGLRIAVNISQDDIWGSTAPNATVAITVTGSGIKGTASTGADEEGNYWTEAYTDSEQVDILPGDSVFAATAGHTATLVIPDPFTAQIDVDTDTVYGEGPAGADLRVEVYDYGEKWVTVDPDGTWSAWFGDQGDLQAGDRGEVSYYTDAGHEVQVYFYSPFLQANVNQSHNWVNGETTPETTVYVTVTRGSEIVGAGEDYTGRGTWFHVEPYDEWGDQANIRPGDVVEVATSEGLTASLEVIPISAHIDPEADTADGQLLDGPIPSQVDVEVWTHDGPGLTFWTDDEGYYFADFSPFDLRPGHTVAVWQVRTDGHRVGIAQAALRIAASSAWDHVWGDTTPGAVVTVTVTGSGVKGTATTMADEDGRYGTDVYSDTQPIELEIGDTVIVEADGRVESWTLPFLTADANPDTDTICGSVPPDGRLRVDVWDVGEEETQADASGNYCLYVGDWVDLEPGHAGAVAYFDDQDYEFQVGWYIPYPAFVRVNQSHDWVDGQTPYPDTDVELSLWDSGGNLKGTGFNRSDENGWFSATQIYTTGTSVDIELGDMVEVHMAGESPIFVEVIPMQGDVNATTETVWGNVAGVPEGSLMRVEMWAGPGSSHETTTDAAGDFTVDFSPDDIKDGYYMAIWYIRPDGNQVGIVRSSLHLGTNLTNDYFWGETSPGLPVTLTLRADDGTPKVEIFATADAEGRIGDNFGADVVPGDTVEAVSADGRFTSVYIEDLSATGDASDDMVYGVAPPNVRLDVNVSGHNEGVNRDTWSDNDGWWGVYVGDIFDIQVGDQGWVIYMNEDGHQIQASFTVEPFIQVHFRNYDWVQGEVPPDAWVEITLLDEVGEVKGNYSDWAGGDGWFGGWCVLDDYGDCVDIAPGDTVEVVYDGSDPIIIPVINITGTVDSAANTITGQILADDLPTDAWADIWWSREEPGQAFSTDDAGNFTVDFSPYDVKPGHWVNIWYTNPDGNQVGAVFSKLRLDVDVHRDEVWGITDPGRTVTLTLRAPDGSIKEEATDVANEDGQFGGSSSEDIAPGDTVEATTNPSTSVYVEDVTIDVDVDADTICGTAPPDAWLQVGIHDGPWWDLAADESGNYCADFSDEYDIRPGDTGEVNYETPEGHRLYYSFNVPFVRVNQSHDWVKGRVQPDVPVTATLLAPDSTIKGIGTTWSGGDGWFHTNFWDEWGDGVDVQVHDTVQVEAGDSFFDVFVIPITGDVDPATDMVCGQMFDGDFPAPFWVDIWGVEGDTHREGMTDEFGNYCADYGGSLDIQEGHEAFVVYINPDGNEVGAVFSYLRVGVGITGNWLDITTAPGLVITATLWSAGHGEVKDIQYDTANEDGKAWLGFDADIQPGDIVEVEADGRVVSLEVVDLSASGDPDTDTVYGTAPPDSYVEAEVWGHDDRTWGETFSDASGNWSIYFGDEFDVRPGDEGRAWWYHDVGHWFQTDFTVPFVGPNLSIPDNITTVFSQTVSVPVDFTANDNDIAAVAFSVDFDETCLAFDPTDGDGDGIPDAVQISVPAAFNFISVAFDGSDTDGELDFTIADISEPLATLPDGTLVIIDFTATCQPESGSTIASVNFSEDPSTSFSDPSGQNVPGTTDDGSVEILSAAPGDCNSDQKVSVADFTAIVLEIFDGDGDSPGDTPGGTFPGDPMGCNANEDTLVNVADLVCTVLIIFNGPGACGGASFTGATDRPVPFSSAVPSNAPGGRPAGLLRELGIPLGPAGPELMGPKLVIPDRVPALPGGDVTLPVNFTAHGNDITSVAFSVDYDETWLNFDPTDGDEDGIPDAVEIGVPPAFNFVSVAFDGSDTDGELDVLIGDSSPPLSTLQDSTLISITLGVDGSTPDATEVAVNFSQDPVASFSDTNGTDVPGTTDNGSVCVLRADVNVDGSVNVDDVTLVAGAWRDASPDPRYDLDKDGGVTVRDVMMVAARFGEVCSGLGSSP